MRSSTSTKKSTIFGKSKILTKVLAWLVIVAMLIEAPLTLFANAPLQQDILGYAPVQQLPLVGQEVQPAPQPTASPLQVAQAAQVAALAQVNQALATTQATRQGLIQQLFQQDAQVIALQNQIAYGIQAQQQATAQQDIQAQISALNLAIAEYNQTMIQLFAQQFELGQEAGNLRAARQDATAVEAQLDAVQQQLANSVIGIENAEAELANLTTMVGEGPATTVDLANLEAQLATYVAAREVTQQLLEDNQATIYELESELADRKSVV